MEEKLICAEGFEELSSSEMMISGGLTWKEVLELLRLLADLAKGLEDYLPDFVDGFKDGWDRV